MSAGLRALEAGDDLTQAGTALSKLYGLTTRQVEALKLLAQEKGLLIAVRTRNPLSIAWERLGALVKPEAIKIKNVDEIDTAFLGYRKVDEGSVVFKRPLTPDQLPLTRAYEEASIIERKAADSRLAKREQEWQTWEAKYKAMARPVTKEAASTSPLITPRMGQPYRARRPSRHHEPSRLTPRPRLRSRVLRG